MSESTQKKLFDIDLLTISEITDVSDPIFNDTQITPVIGSKFIVFMINDTHYAIASKRVSEVVRPLPYTPLPNFPGWLYGIANLRGDIISIINLRNLLIKEPYNTTKTKLIVLRTQESDSQIAFKVDKLREIVMLEDRDITPTEDIDSPYIFGTSTHKLNTIFLLDVEKILSSLKLS
jgi:purine-binding chemotaxis protein CheW